MPLPDLARFYFFFLFWIQEETTQESPSNIWTMRKVIFKTDGKRKKIAVDEQLIGEEKKVYCLCQRTFYVLPLFLWAATNGLKPSHPSQYSILRLWRKNTKLKEDEFLSVLWIINLKNTEKSCRASCHDFSCRLSLSIQATNLNFLNFNTIRGYIRESVFMYVYIYLCVI